MEAIDVLAFAAHYWCWVSFKVRRTGAGQVVVRHSTDGVRATNSLDFTWVLTSVLNASLSGETFNVIATANVAVTFGDTGLIGGAAIVDNARLDAEIVHAPFAAGTLAVNGAHKATLPVYTFLTVTAIRV